MNFIKTIIPLVVFLFYQGASAQTGGYSASGGSLNQVTRMQATWFEDFKSKVKDSENAPEIEKVYFDMEKGPYYGKKWYDAEFVTNQGEVLKEDIKVRFDMYQHNIHFTKDYRDIKALETSQIKEFYLIDEDKKRKFVKIYPSINQYSPNFSYYEVLHEGKYAIYNLIYSTLEVNNYMGPGSDGRTRVSFDDHKFLYIKGDDGFYKKIQFNKKYLAEVFEKDLAAYENYIKENKKLKSTEDLISFISSLDNI